MKVALSIFSLLVAGILNLSGWASTPQLASESGCIFEEQAADFVIDAFQYYPNHKDHTEFKIAEFEIEESSEKDSPSNQLHVLQTACTGPQLEGVCNFHLSLAFTQTRARSNLAGAVKPYILFQVFRL
ncbi:MULTISPECIES: hypothetical protein [unclassified Leeuwenhoekiella]|uniref:hypothetical protein n=1 Tax=unclassified Leeuwenhoekiella TaxID=2615029 RepID=UPI000C4355D5|nr:MULTISPECIES: hypothetical protein [unclassified Leeuwenhoekiella]MAW94975.1 hypothetical protein [Leeuwenhoekiella sp.]MBA79695.1 hypothetical protein [Leeuwenhoekiella sp.]|tara:strand:- start:8895 stop:9278 length:384 start_codon:yes stop_codon:yes gene_type:complete